MPPKRTKKQQKEALSNQAGPSEAVTDAGEREELLKELQEVEDICSYHIPPKPEVSTNGKCLLITHIDVDNFKSYSGKQTIGPFHHALSCIVGPNGSGKSNVIDSLLFVFGFRSNKIRAPKLSSFIHHSANRNAESCSVTVNFKLFAKDSDDPLRAKVLESFAIGRIVDQNNKSKYSFNGKTAQFKDIQTKLKNAGIDLDHNRFLILQGEVEQISLMKAKAEKEGEEGMLEYLDDIIGTSRFCKPIKLFSLKLELVGTERESQMNKLNIVEIDRQNLSEPVRELLELLVLENKISALKNKLFCLKRVEYSKKLEEVKPKIDEAKAANKLFCLKRVEYSKKLEEAQPKIDEAKAAVDEKKKELEDLMKKLKEQKKTITRHQKEADKHKQLIADTEKQLSDEKLKLQKCDLSLNKTKTRKEEKEKEIVKEEKKITTLTDRPEKNNAEIEDLKLELDAVKEIIEEKQPLLQERLAECQQKTDELNNDRNKIGEKLAAAKQKEDEANAELTLAQSQKISMTEEVKRCENRIKSSNEMAEQAKEKIKATEREKDTFERQIPLLDREIKDAQAELRNLEPKEPILADEYARLRQQYNAASADCSSDQRKKATLQMLMREKSNGNIPGLRGRLGNLGAIDPEFDVAISTTCGQLDMIVCDTHETVNKCLKFVDEHKLDRTTFVACEKIAHLRDKMQKIKTPEDAPRLFDLIECGNNEEIKLAFYFCLRDTLIVDDIVTARRISSLWGANKRFRVVTKNGEVVDITGTLTGGGNAVRRGRINTNVQVMAAAENHEDLIPRINEKKTLLDEIRAEISSLRNAVETKSRQLDQAKVELQRCSQTIEQSKSELKTAENTVKELTQKLAETNVNEEELQKVEEKIEQLEEKRNNMTEAAEKVKRDFDEISRKIDAIYEEISGTLKKEVDEKKARQTQIEGKIKTLRTAASKAEIDLQKSNEKLESMQTAVAEMEEELQRLEENKVAIKEEIDELSAFLEDKKRESEEIEARLEAAQAEINEVDEKEVGLKREIANGNDEIAKLKDEVKHVEAKFAEITTKIEKLKTYDIKEILADKTLEKDKKTASKKKKKNAKTATTSILGGMDENSDESDLSSSESEDDNEEEEEPEVRSTTPAASSRAEAAADSNDENSGTLPTYSDEEIAEFDSNEIQCQLNVVENERAGIEVAMNLNLIEEYRTKLRECRREGQILKEITEKRDKIRNRLDELKRLRVEEFMEGFTEIALSLKEQYQKLTMGGDADLELVDPMDPYSEGIKFCVRPKGKGWRPMNLTSGGEKTLSSLSLVFALHHFRPTPFYVMDEIDAALDARNVMLIAHFVKERAETAQFIIISLREQMFNLADRLIGIFKVNDCTQNVVTPGVECIEDAATATKSHEFIIGTDAEEKSVIRNKLRRRLEEDETDNVAASKRARKVM
uniref:Structural maintenance of chromosomes protein n=1 Tax=Panagrolaimus sp. PS1159 TaxID=55785 RepID=A0AC35GPB2_9BILA